MDVDERRDVTTPSALRLSPRPQDAHHPDDSATDSLLDTRDADELRRALVQQKRAFDLAMTASQMGSWRYTLADNVCIYDDNAQRLYGLLEARFLHDEEGVKAKFHPDDLELMWSRVATALDPRGDGKYDVEYRVRQLDGSWRWLSAWGLVEFDGDGPSRKPLAIAGASRDLTERKQAEEHQQLLLNELQHRVKNALATFQAIATLTLTSARDLPSAREALDGRVLAMARAHDLLTTGVSTSAQLADIVAQALEAFSPNQVKISGPAIDISSKHTLGLSLALHELATNAAKYGALSCSEGCVRVHWQDQDGVLRLDWEESGGPPVAPPSRKGFGSRLLERILVRDLSGTIKLDYQPSGLRCGITARL
jgi:two-component sensor histidine kinase